MALFYLGVTYLFSCGIVPLLVSVVGAVYVLIEVKDGSASLTNSARPPLQEAGQSLQFGSPGPPDHASAVAENPGPARCPSCGAAITTENVRCPSCEFALR